MAMSQSEHDDLIFNLGQKFKPAQPINREDLFSGRRFQTLEVLDAINQNGQHVVLHGERGVGKTSLANMISYKLRCEGKFIMTPHINCTSEGTIDDLWTAVFLDMRFRGERAKITLPRAFLSVVQELESELRTSISLEMLREIFEKTSERMINVVIFDEFDNLKNDRTRQQMAETIKSFSDRNVPATIMLIGVAENIETLIADHRSIDRCLVQVRMPRMSREEIGPVRISVSGEQGTSFANWLGHAALVEDSEVV